MQKLTDVADQVVRLSSALAFALVAACAASQAVSLWRGLTTHHAVVTTQSFTPSPYGDAG